MGSNFDRSCRGSPPGRRHRVELNSDCGHLEAISRCCEGISPRALPQRAQYESHSRMLLVSVYDDLFNPDRCWGAGCCCYGREFRFRRARARKIPRIRTGGIWGNQKTIRSSRRVGVRSSCWPSKNDAPTLHPQEPAVAEELLRISTRAAAEPSCSPGQSREANEAVVRRRPVLHRYSTDAGNGLSKRPSKIERVN